MSFEFFMLNFFDYRVQLIDGFLYEKDLFIGFWVCTF